MSIEQQANEAMDRYCATVKTSTIRKRMEVVYGSRNLITNIIRAIKRGDALEF